MIVKDLKNTKPIDDEITELSADLDINRMAEDNALKAQSQEGCARKYNVLCERYDSYKKKIDDFTNEKQKEL